MKAPTAEEVREAEAEHSACRDRTGRSRTEFDRWQRELQHLSLAIKKHLAERPHVVEVLPDDPLVVAWESRSKELQDRKNELISLRDRARGKFFEDQKAEKEAAQVMWEKKAIFLNRETRAAELEFQRIEREWRAANAELVKCERDRDILQGQLSEINVQLRDAYLTDEEAAELESEKELLNAELAQARAAVGEARGRDLGLRMEGVKAANKFEALRHAHRVAKSRADGDALIGPVSSLSAVS